MHTTSKVIVIIIIIIIIIIYDITRKHEVHSTNKRNQI